MSRGEVVGLNSGRRTLLRQAPVSMADSIFRLTAREYQATLWTQDADLKGHRGVKYKAKTA